MKIDWDKVGGLLPVVVQEFDSNEVLMLAFMNEQALNLSLQTGYAHYFSRTKNRIWKKGEESGNVQKIYSAHLDCDNDTLLLKVEQIGGVACHTGEKSCFFRELLGAGELNGELNLAGAGEQNLTQEQNLSIASNHTKKPAYDIIDEVYHVILERKFNADPETSYVAKLFKKGENAILKKVGEEATEFVMACKDATAAQNLAKQSDESRAEISVDRSNLTGLNLTDQSQTELNLSAQKAKTDLIYEAADLCFHTLVALAAHGVHPDQIKAELARRFGLSGIEEKNSRDDK